MRKIVEEVDGEGLESFLGRRITLLCMNYIYTGRLIGMNATCVLLEDAAIVYETGPWAEKAYKDAQPLPSRLYVQLAAIESFGPLKG